VIFSYSPKAYLIIGNLAEFSSGTGVNSAKYSSFELLRRNVINSEVITFDELYERAKFIVQTNEEQGQQVAAHAGVETPDYNSDDIP
jgi:hypothetical protein